MAPKFWRVVIGVGLMLSLSRSSVTQDVAPKKPVLTLRAAVVPHEKLGYQYDWFRRLWSYGELACVVRNVSKRPITITYTAVCWYTNWGTDSPFVRVVGWGSTANLPMRVVLMPGETYSKAVPVTFDDLPEGQKVTFRVRFNSNSEREPIPSHSVWSTPITTYAPKAKP